MNDENLEKISKFQRTGINLSGRILKMIDSSLKTKDFGFVLKDNKGPRLGKARGQDPMMY